MGIGIFYKQICRYDIDPGIGALGGQHRGNQQLKRCTIIQSGGHAAIRGFQHFQNRCYPLFQDHSYKKFESYLRGIKFAFIGVYQYDTNEPITQSKQSTIKIP